MTAPGQARNAYPAMRIFIFGQEVTEDVLSCSVNWSDNSRAPGTCEIVLANKFDRYIVTENDIHALYDDIDINEVTLPDRKPTVASESSRDIINFLATDFLREIETNRPEYPLSAERNEDDLIATTRRVLQRAIQDDVKERVILAKFDKVQDVSQPGVDETGVGVVNQRRPAYLEGEAFRYPFFVGDCIFHSNDPVRVFWRDPLEHNYRIASWYYMFSGFVSDWTDSISASNERAVIIRCEDVLRPLRYARITTNPGVGDIDDIRQNEDFVVRTAANEGFLKLTLSELIYTLVFGPEVPNTITRLGIVEDDIKRILRADHPTIERHAANGQTTEQVIPRLGVGSFDFSRSATFVFGPTDKAPAPETGALPQVPELQEHEVNLDGENALAIYQAIIDHRVLASDIDTTVLAGFAPVDTSNMRRDKYDALIIDDVITAIGENPQLYPVDGGRLFILAPASLGPNINRAVLSSDLIADIATQTSIKSRLEMIYGVAERLQFSFRASPKGDLLLEMPLFTFEPSDFLEESVSVGQVLFAIKSGDPAVGLRAAEVRQQTFENARSAIAAGVASDLDTGDRGPYGPHYRIPLRNILDHQRSFSDERVRTQFRVPYQNAQALPALGTSEDLWKREVITLRSLVPQFGVRIEPIDPTIFIASPQAAHVYGLIRASQINAEAYSAQIDILPNLRITPNRPIEVTDRSYVATARDVGHRLDWAGHDMSMTVGLNYMRRWDGQVTDDSRPLYSPIGGFAGEPLNYALLFQKIRPRTSSKKRRGQTPKRSRSARLPFTSSQ